VQGANLFCRVTGYENQENRVFYYQISGFPGILDLFSANTLNYGGFLKNNVSFIETSDYLYAVPCRQFYDPRDHWWNVK